MRASAPLEELIEALRCLPGIGPKAAQRLAYHLLQHDRGGADRLRQALEVALQKVKRCHRCNGFSDGDVCGLCSSPQRDPAALCVVETPGDLAMVEQTLAFRGNYFVLMGRLSPLDGLGPRDISIDSLMRRVDDGIVKEVIIATNFTNEGEATAHYLSELLRSRGLRVTRLARGVPLGGELEFVDAGTIAHAFHDRRPV